MQQQVIPRVIQFVIALGLLSIAALADNWQISGGGDSGKLLVDHDGAWRSICYSNYVLTDNQADAACESIGYRRSSDVYPITLDSSTPEEQRPTICSILCFNYEAKSLEECDLTVAIRGSCNCDEAVGITCTNSLSVEMIVVIVVAILIIIGILLCFISCIFCCRTSPCYYKKNRSHTIVVTRRTPPQVVAMSTARVTTTHQPPAPPAYDPNTGYQPVPPTATTAKY